MDLRKLLGTLDSLTEGTMASAKKKDTGPKFVGKMKGTDPASAAKDKYVGSSMEESIFKELEATLKKDPEKRDLMKEFREFKEAKAATASFRAGNAKRANLNAMSDEERRAYDKEQQEKQRKRDDARLERERQKLAAKKGVSEGADERKQNALWAQITAHEKAAAKSKDLKRQHHINMANQLRSQLKTSDNELKEFSELDLAVMEGGHELVNEAPVAPVAGQPAQPLTPAGKPQLGTNVANPQQQVQQQTQQAKQQADAAKQAQLQQQQLQKGVNSLKSAGAAVSNAGQTAQAFNKVNANTALSPTDKTNIASAGTALAPIMSNPQLAGKFKDLVSQAGAEQKKQQQQAQQQAQAPQAPQPATGAQQ